jgi:phosphoglycerate dehydrogenase-like enzyme
VLVNIGRGSVIDEEALYMALKEHSIGAAGLDVWYNYPASDKERAGTLPAALPFWELENVVLSPHRAGLTEGIDLLRMRHLARLLNAAAKNERIPNHVDLAAGY